jgi:two-component system chemotaxis response regulator CheB
MPRMDGVTFLKKIMAERPTPVVICSSLTQAGAETTMQALAAGAVSIITKPTVGLKDFLRESSNDVVAAVRAAAVSRVRNLAARPAAAGGSAGPERAAGRHPRHGQTTDSIVAIGTSTGGTQALEVVLTALPATAPGIVIVQHMPEKFTASFAERLNGLCEIDVFEAKDGQRVLPGRP